MSLGSSTRAPGVDVEVATWPPVVVHDVAGWRAGVSGGFTRRANSVVAATEPEDLDGAVRAVEELYAGYGQRPVFRVCAQTLPDGLAEHLDARGYRRVATTHVMVRELAARAASSTRSPTASPAASPTGSGAAASSPAEDAVPDVAVDVAATPGTDWLAGWLGVKADGRVDTGTARAIVTGAPAHYLTARDAEGVVGVARVARAGSWAGVSCVMVAPRARRRGIATVLSRAALRTAAGSGAECAFLQVEEENEGARALYAGLGFRWAATYHYQER